MNYSVIWNIVMDLVSLAFLCLLAMGAYKIWRKSKDLWPTFRRRGASWEIYNYYCRVTFGGFLLSIYSIIVYVIYLVHRNQYVMITDAIGGTLGTIILLFYARSANVKLSNRGRETNWLEIMLNIALPSFLAFEFWLKYKAPSWMLLGLKKVMPALF